MTLATNSNESYCTFTLAPDATAGGLPSQEEISKDLESNDDKVCERACDGVHDRKTGIDSSCV